MGGYVISELRTTDNKYLEIASHYDWNATCNHDTKDLIRCFTIVESSTLCHHRLFYLNPWPNSYHNGYRAAQRIEWDTLLLSEAIKNTKSCIHGSEYIILMDIPNGSTMRITNTMETGVVFKRYETDKRTWERVWYDSYERFIECIFLPLEGHCENCTLIIDKEAISGQTIFVNFPSSSKLINNSNTGIDLISFGNRTKFYMPNQNRKTEEKKNTEHDAKQSIEASKQNNNNNNTSRGESDTNPNSHGGIMIIIVVILVFILFIFKQ